MKIKQEILKLKQTDLYSLILFVLFKLKDIPEYSALSELAFVLDKDNFLNLCEYFGGLTIKIPTINELQSIVYSLTLYQKVDIEGMGFEEALKVIGRPDGVNLSKIKSDYYEIVKLMEDYSFGK